VRRFRGFGYHLSFTACEKLGLEELGSRWLDHFLHITSIISFVFLSHFLYSSLNFLGLFYHLSLPGQGIRFVNDTVINHDTLEYASP
jgi:hypothetical protein